MAQVPRPNYWGRLYQFALPYSIIQNGRLVLSPSSLAILMVLYESIKNRAARPVGSNVEIKITQKLLRIRGGLSKNTPGKAIKELCAKHFIQNSAPRNKHGHFGVYTYTLRDPQSGLPLVWPRGSNVLLGNKVRYIKLPRCMVKESGAIWSIAGMSGSELRMYAAVTWLANSGGQGRFGCSLRELKRLAGFSTLQMAQNAIEGLENKGLLLFDDDHVVLHDPYTGEPLHEQSAEADADPANYYAIQERGRAARLNFNNGDAAQIERLLKNIGLNPVSQHDSELSFSCPYHDDSTPSCYLNTSKRCFYCHGCQAKGSLTSLLMHVRKVDKAAALRLMAESTGQKVDFHEPDMRAEAIYSYHDVQGRLVKQVLRYPGKGFSQRRPAGGGDWIWDAHGMSPMLYKLDLLRFSTVICICEGEKDCDTVSELNLYGSSGDSVIATTSGNAESWRDHLADHLKGKQIVLMPDADEAGAKFAAAIQASLNSRGIEYRIVTFDNAGAKDVSDFLANGGTKEELIQRIGIDWVRATPEVRHEPDPNITL